MKRLSKRTIYWEYIIVYLLLLFKAGFMFCELYSAYTSISLLLMVLIWTISKRYSIQNVHIFVVLVVLFCIFLSYIANGFPDFNRVTLGVINWATALFIVTVIPFERFSRCFSNIIYVICICSLIGHLLFLAKIPIITNLPLLANSQGRTVYFALLAEFWSSPQNGTYRLQGIFWEPGAFQAMIIIAMLLDIYINHPAKRLVRFFCYLVTLFFTYSTTGFLCAMVILLLIAVKGKKFSVRQIFAFSSVFIFLIFIVMRLYSSAEGFLYYSTFGKLEMMSDAYIYGDDNAASSRWISVLVPLNFFLKSPIFGVGESGLEEMTRIVGHSMFTCSPVNYISYYGLLCGIVCFVGFFKLCNFRQKSIVESMVLVLLLLLTTSSENLAFNPILSCFMLYGFVSPHSYKKIGSSITINGSKNIARNGMLSTM